MAAKKSAEIRHELETHGEHIPSFLIASITENCNLHCAGCYAMANRPYVEHPELSTTEWNRIFDEAQTIGVSVILLAGGEPLLRRDVLGAAANHKNLLFPVFTKGTLLADGYIKLFAANRNLLPIVSIEGDAAHTDARRGNGIFDNVVKTINSLSKTEIV